MADLFPHDLKRQAPAIKGLHTDDPVVHAKWYLGDAADTWYLLAAEGDQVLVLHSDESNVTAKVMPFAAIQKAVGQMKQPVERDHHWKPVTVSQVLQQTAHNKHLNLAALKSH